MKKYKIIILVTLILTTASSFFAANAQESISLAEREKHIQEALELRSAQQYGSALAKLDLILNITPTDEPVLLLKGDILLQAQQFQNAVNVYKVLLPLQYEGTIVRINLSYALFMNKNASEALVFARSAWENDSQNANATINYFNALLWNGKTDDANEFLLSQSENLKEEQSLVMKARLYTSSGDYKNGLAHYSQLVTSFPNKHYAREYFEVLLSKKEISRASELINSQKHLYTTGEVNSLFEQLDGTQNNNISTDVSYFEDIAKNKRVENSISWQQPEGANLRFGIRLGMARSTSPLQSSSESKFAGVTLFEKFSMGLVGKTELNVGISTIGSENKSISILGKQTIQYKPTDRTMVGLYLSSDILNYTVTLFRQNIRNNSVGYMFHSMFDGKNGVYSQGGFSSFSDGNKKYEFFGSYYHLFNTQPLIKAGLNITLLSFQNNVPQIYFSPEKYISTEIFAEYASEVSFIPGMDIKAQGAIGLQNSQSSIWNESFRLQSELTYQISNFGFSVIYQTSNVASRTGSGYQFDKFSFKLNWKI